jgi:hypothetical protein
MIKINELISRGKFGSFVNHYGGVLLVSYDALNSSGSEILQRLQVGALQQKAWSN